MRLRTSLLLGYAYLVGLLLISSASAIVGFHSLSTGIDSILKENFTSIRAAMDMVEALERQDSATLGQLIDPGHDPAAAQATSQKFDAALARAKANVTLERERPLLQAIQSDYQAFRTAQGRLLASRPEHPLVAYRRSTYQAFVKVKDGLISLLELNHGAMRQADLEARQAAVRSGVWLGVLVLVALFSLVMLSRRLHQRLLLRLDELAAATEAIAAGDVHRRLPVSTADELGRIATWVNEELDEYQLVRSEMAGRLGRERQLALALFDALGSGRILLDLGGRVIAQDPDRDDPRLCIAAEGWIRDRASPGSAQATEPADLAGPIQIQSEGARFSLQLLTARDQLPVAWVAWTAEAVEEPVQATSS